MMLSEGARETPSGDLLGERVADRFDVVFIEPTSTPVTQITYDTRGTYVSDTRKAENVHQNQKLVVACYLSARPKTENGLLLAL